MTQRGGVVQAGFKTTMVGGHRQTIGKSLVISSEDCDSELAMQIYAHAFKTYQRKTLSFTPNGALYFVSSGTAGFSQPPIVGGVDMAARRLYDALESVAKNGAVHVALPWRMDPSGGAAPPDQDKCEEDGEMNEVAVEVSGMNMANIRNQYEAEATKNAKAYVTKFAAIWPMKLLKVHLQQMEKLIRHDQLGTSASIAKLEHLDLGQYNTPELLEEAAEKGKHFPDWALLQSLGGVLAHMKLPVGKGSARDGDAGGGGGGGGAAAATRSGDQSSRSRSPLAEAILAMSASFAQRGGGGRHDSGGDPAAAPLLPPPPPPPPPPAAGASTYVAIAAFSSSDARLLTFKADDTFEFAGTTTVVPDGYRFVRCIAGESMGQFGLIPSSFVK